MADKFISELDAATLPLTGSELAPVVQDGTTKRATVADLQAIAAAAAALAQETANAANANANTRLLASLVSTFALTLLDDANAGAARATLGVAYASQAEMDAMQEAGRVASPAIIGKTIRDVRYFGAKMDGTTDDAPAFTAAIADLPASGGDLRVPMGETRWGSGVVFDKPGAIVGRGKGATVVWANFASGDLLRCTGSYQDVVGLGFKSSVTRTSGAYVHFDTTSARISARDLMMSGAIVGIRQRCPATALFQSIDILDCIATSGIGILIEDGLDVSLINVLLDGAAQAGAGVRLVNSGDVTLADCNLIHAGVALQAVPGAGQVVASLSATNCYFDNSTTGVQLEPQSPTGGVVRSRFMGCWSGSNSTAGVIINANGGTLSGAEFVSHQSFLNGTYGIHVQHANTLDVQIIGGKFAANDEGIHFNAGVTRFGVIGARVGNTDGLAGNTNAGISVAGGGGTSGYRVIGCDCSGNVANNFFDGGGAVTKAVANNLT